MPHQPSVVDTLRVVTGLLRLARKAVIDARHIDDMIEIDTLMQIAQIEAERQIANETTWAWLRLFYEEPALPLLPNEARARPG